MKKLKIGVIGTGRIGRLHILNMLQLPQIEIAAVSDISPEAEWQEWARSLGVAIITTDYEQLLADKELEAVFVCSPTKSHLPIVRKAAQAGKHIFCEKPLSFDPDSTKEVLNEVDKAGVQLQVGFNRRFDHNFKRVRELVEQGQAGKPHLIKITSRDPYPPTETYIRSSGGLFMDMSIHDFDMARYLAASEVVEVYAKGAVLVDSVFEELGDIDTAVITLTFANGALGIIDNSRKAAYGYDQRVEVFGSKGCITVSNDFSNSAEIMTEHGVHRDKPLLFFLERYRNAFREEVIQFCSSIQQGTPVPVSGFDGLQAERIAEAARQSLRDGVPVSLEVMQHV